jgi:replication factor C subunit 3/5
LERKKADSDIWGLQTVAERVVDRVDEALKADIMHWAAIYVMKHSSG